MCYRCHENQDQFPTTCDVIAYKDGLELGIPRSVSDDNMSEDDLLALGFQMLSDDFES